MRSENRCALWAIRDSPTRDFNYQARCNNMLIKLTHNTTPSNNLN